MIRESKQTQPSAVSYSTTADGDGQFWMLEDLGYTGSLQWDVIVNISRGGGTDTNRWWSGRLPEKSQGKLELEKRKG